MNKQKFFRCNHCGNFTGLIDDSGVAMVCCGEPMEELFPNTVEAATEKHIPAVSKNGRLVHATVGSVPHPMTEEHHIKFIYLQTENGGQRRTLKIETEAAAMFAVIDDQALEVFAYCNVHGLWKAEIPCDCGCEDTKSENETDENDEIMACSAEFATGCI